MIKIDDKMFESVFKVDMMASGKKHAGGVIFAHNNKDALRIAQMFVKDVEERIRQNKEDGYDC